MINWKKQALGDVLEYTQPSHFIVNNTEYDPEFQIPVLTPGKSFILGYTNEKEGIYDRLPTIIFDDFTTAFKYVDFPFKVKSSAMKMLNTTSVNFDIKFIYYLMQTINFEAKEHKRYWISKYSKLQVRIPPLEEQKKIAAILDAADDYRKKTKALINKYDQLTQSLFLDMFGDPFKGEVSPLKNNITVLGGYAFKSKDFIQVGLPLIKIGTVNKGYFEIDNFSFLPESYLSNYSKWNVRPGDILMSLTGTVGKDDYGNVEKATDHYENYLLNQRVAKLEPSNGIYLKEFLFGMFRNNKTKKELTKISRGVRQANISNRDIENLEMITPRIEDQKLYVSAISEIEKQKQQAEASLVKAEELFSSLLQRAFMGELTS